MDLMQLWYVSRHSLSDIFFEIAETLLSRILNMWGSGRRPAVSHTRTLEDFRPIIFLRRHLSHFYRKKWPQSKFSLILIRAILFPVSVKKGLVISEQQYFHFPIKMKRCLKNCQHFLKLIFIIWFQFPWCLQSWWPGDSWKPLDFHQHWLQPNRCTWPKWIFQSMLERSCQSSQVTCSKVQITKLGPQQG